MPTGTSRVTTTTLPLPRCQGTVAAPVRFAGRGLHSGLRTHITVLPHIANGGIVFRHRRRKGETIEIPARWDKVRSRPLCTCLAENGAQVRTVEHLLASLYACGVDNAVIEVQGSEVPLLDGSAGPFVQAIQLTGITRENIARHRWRVKKPIRVTSGKSWARLRPAPRLVLDVTGGLGGFPAMRWKGPMNRRVFTRQIVHARTYGHLVHGLQAKLFTFFLPNPLCLGAGLHNAVVVHRGRVLTPGGLRYRNEFVRHRVLDLMGDLMLAGGDLVGHLTCWFPTHELNRRLLEALFADDSAYTSI
jgi:UDP-3-O-[3-hydroxymyristoyl] N-acetylglucosamine deacetylase